MTQDRLVKIDECTFIGSFFNISQLPKDRLPQIAFAGRSNVGKSSLLNKLVGNKKAAKTSSTPGKTQSLNFFKINGKMYFVDLPGYGYAKVPKKIRESWGKLMEEYFEKNQFLAGLILLLDCRRELTDEDIQLLGWLASREVPAMIVVTKADKLTRDKVNRRVAKIENDLGLPAIPFSVVSGEGKRELLSSIADLLALEN